MRADHAHPQILRAHVANTLATSIFTVNSLWDCRQHHIGHVPQFVFLGRGARLVRKDAVGSGICPTGFDSRHLPLVPAEYFPTQRSAGGVAEVHNHHSNP